VSTDSFSDLTAQLRDGDPEAADEIVRRFTAGFMSLAQRQLDARMIGGKVAPEDIVQSVYRSFFTRQREGEFDLPSWDNLWSLLTTMTVHKCADRADYFLAARRDARLEIGLSQTDDLRGSR
jgi:RNA polymerase sigma-70 factor (ECF subfamily)